MSHPSTRAILTTQELTQKKIGLFISCPVDLFRPSIAQAVVDVLRSLNCHIDVPAQTCCGQVGYNNGDTTETRKVALSTAKQFAHCDFVVIPSGSCGAMLKHHYIELFENGTKEHAHILAFANKVYEFTQFLTEIVGVEKLSQRIDLSHLKITYHDSCSGLREMKIKEQPRDLLKLMSNVSIQEMPDTNVCCGFGGTFCVKYSDISNKMVSDKIRNAESVDADVLVGGDLSCLLNIAGAISRHADEATDNKKILQVRHIAELLAGNMETPAIGSAVNGAAVNGVSSK